MDKIIRWGIVGTGGIARRFAEACKNTPGASLAAVASRSQKTADAFADEFAIEKRFASYEDMASSDDIDIAYIATPHGTHAPNAILFMNAGKAVMTEKPAAVNLRQLDSMIESAKKNDVFFMEAMWARLAPGTYKALEIVNSGVLGKIGCVQGSFCFEMYDEPDHHVFDPAQGGGSLLDVGCYALSFSSWYLGNNPIEIKAVADIGKTGVDEHCCVLMKYPGGEIAQLSSAIMLPKPNEGYIFGEKGYLYMKRFYAPQKIEMHLSGKDMQEIDCPYIGNGFEEQILEASGCLREGRKESTIITHEQSRLIAGQMDAIRALIGVKYPAD